MYFHSPKESITHEADNRMCFSTVHFTTQS